MKRQKIRRLIILIMLLLFPVTMWYFSPYLIIQGAFEHVVNGSFIVFCAMFVASLFLGRAWCGYLCPAGGLQECGGLVNDKPAKLGWRKSIKYIIWALMVGTVITFYILGNAGITVDFFYMTDHGVSVTGLNNYIIYYGVIFLLFLPSVIHGKRAACHYLCWMAPFMILGGKLGRVLHLPQLHVKAKKENCVSCGKCNKECPMGLDVLKMVQTGKNGKCSDCIQCGACVDACKKDVLSLIMRR